MRILKPVYFASVVILALLSAAAAQESATVQRSTLTITASAAGERVRITAPASVVQLHVEVYAASGEKLFDQEIEAATSSIGTCKTVKDSVCRRVITFASSPPRASRANSPRR